MRYMISDELWTALGPVVAAAKRNRQGPAPTLPDRAFFEALLYLARTGVPWRDLPAEFGNWDAVYNRFRRWVHSGSLRALFEALTADPAFGPVRRVFLDSTIVRTHVSGAGAPKKRAGRRPRGSAAAAAG